MKTHLIAIILLFGLLHFGKGQNYQTINSGRTYFFSGTDDIKSIRIDSVEYNEDSIL